MTYVDSATWWASYRAYLQTPEWREKRALVLQRDRRCTLCDFYPATHAHHLTYAHVGRELLGELTGVCSGCHHELHR